MLGISAVELAMSKAGSVLDDRLTLELHMFRSFRLLLAISLLAVALPLYAQTGCTDSPESPTIILAMVAGITGIAVGLRAMRKRKT